jgi:hypothetical protein
VGTRAGLDMWKISPPTGIRSPDHPARSSVAIPTELPGPQSRIKPIYYIQHTFPVIVTVFELIKQKGSYADSSTNLNRTFSH